jgi:hypothetical protein
LPIELDITDRLFYEVWIEALEQVNQAFTDSMNKEKNEVVTTPTQPNVFNPQTLPITNQPTKIWDSELGAYK